MNKVTCCPLLMVVSTLRKMESKLETLMGVKVVCFHFNLTEGPGLRDITTCLEANLGHVRNLHTNTEDGLSSEGGDSFNCSTTLKKDYRQIWRPLTRGGRCF